MSLLVVIVLTLAILINAAMAFAVADVIACALFHRWLKAREKERQTGL